MANKKSVKEEAKKIVPATYPNAWETYLGLVPKEAQKEIDHQAAFAAGVMFGISVSNQLMETEESDEAYGARLDSIVEAAKVAMGEAFQKSRKT